MMYKMCKTEQSAIRQRQLEAGLLEAMSLHRYEEISVSDLCNQLEIPRKSFYRYFPSKDDALNALIDHTLMEYDAYTTEYQRSSGRSVQLDLESFFQFWFTQRKLLDALVRSGISGILMERAIAFALTDEVMPTRFLPGDSREMQKHITMFGVCGLIAMVLTWHHDGFASSAREQARIATRMLSQPLFPNVDRLI